MGWNWIHEPCGIVHGASAPAPPHNLGTGSGESGYGSGKGQKKVAGPDRAATLAAAVTPAAIAELRARGWAVLGPGLDLETATALRAELEELRVAGGLHPNKTAFGRPARTFVKPRVFEYDMHAAGADPVAVGRLARFRCAFDHASTELVDRLNELMPELGLARGSRAVVVKLQYNAGGGGCFPLHYDNPGLPNRRALTCLVYLNPSWAVGDGGELQLVPFCDDSVQIAPLHGRVVLFKSDSVLHRVLPAVRPRYCFTVWLDVDPATGEVERPLPPPAIASGNIAAIAEWYRRGPQQRALSRSVYREAYEKSLIECQGEGAPCMVAEHHAAVGGMQSNPKLAELIEQLRAYAQTRTEWTYAGP